MSKFFIDRPIFAAVIGIVIIILGAVSALRLPVALYPSIVPPTIQVTTSYPGASAQIVADTVGVPIEQQVNGVPGSIYMTSTSAADGTYTLTVTFEVGTDLDSALTQVQNFVSTALSQLPEAVQAQGVEVRKVSTNILQVVSIYSEEGLYNETFLSNYAIINLENPLARLPGVGQIKVSGAGEYSMRVWLDPEKLKNNKLTAYDVQQVIRQQNLQVVAGQLGGPPTPPDQVFQFTMNALGRLSDVEQFENIIVKTERGESARVVRIRDLGRVELSQQTFSVFAGLSGKPSTQIIVYSLPGANALSLAESVRAAMEEMSQRFPEGLDYSIRYDTTIFIEESINAVYETLFEALALVLIVILVFLQNLRATVIPAVVVPITIVGAFAAMLALGFGINLMTLFALILAIGIVVDDAIIVVENSSHYIETGMTPRDATVKAMSEMAGPIVATSLVLAAVFLPAAALPGITGQLFRQFALVIASTAVISAIAALTLSPAQCAQLLKPKPKDKKPNAFYRAFNAGYGAVERSYVALVTRMVHRPKIMALLFFAIIGATGWQFARHPTGFLPTEDQGYAIIIARLPDAAAQPRAREVSKKIDEVLATSPGIADWVTIGGFSMLDAANISTIVTTFAIYEGWKERGADLDQEAIVANLRRELGQIEEAGFAVVIPPPISGLGQSGGFQMMIEDRESRGFYALTQALQEVIRVARTQSSLGGVTTTFSANSPQLYLDIDRVKAESLDVPVSDVFDTLQAYLGSAYVNLFNKFNQVFQVYVQADSQFRLTPDDIGNLYVRNERGDMVPIGALIDIERTLGSELVTRYNLYPAAPVFGGPAPGYSSGQALNLMEQVATSVLPAGMGYDWTATAFQERKIGNQAYFIYALSITLVFLVLAAQYESWFSPAAVIMTVPLAMSGVLLALMARGLDNNLYTQVGLVLMIALASKNAILIVEFARELRAGGMSIVEAAVESTRRRFRPIMMTSFSFIAGVIPLLIASGAGAASQQSIGTVVFGGMLASTLIAIPFVPVFYVLFQSWEERGRKTEPAAAAEEPAE